MLSNRVKLLKPSPTLALAAKAKALKSQGHDVISLTVGEPDWDTYDNIKHVAKQAIDWGETKYTPSNGNPELREAIAVQTSGDLSVDYDPSEVTVSTGGKFVIFSALQSVLNPGDEVIIPAPYWVSYPTQVELAEGHPIVVKTKSENRFTLTASEFSAAITPKTKLLILNSPSNPTGNMYTAEGLKEISEVLDRHPNILVMSDDIYNRLVFTESGLAPHLLHVAPHLKDRTIIINGVSKTYAMTGWRLGWALGHKDIIGAMTNYQSQSVSCVPGFIQRAAVTAIKNTKNEFSDSLKKLKSRRDKVIKLLQAIPNIEVSVPDGAFYIWPNISHFFGRVWKGKVLETSSDFSAALLESKMVVVVPGVEFGQEGYLRLSYALSEDQMSMAIGRFADFLKEIN